MQLSAAKNALHWSEHRGQLKKDLNGLSILGHGSATAGWKSPPTHRVIRFPAAHALTEIATGSVGARVAPLLHERLKLGVIAVGQDDLRRNEQIAGAPPLRDALALEAKGAAFPAFGIDSSTAPPSVGTRTLLPSTAS